MQSVEASISTLPAKLFARPYMTDPDRFRETDENGRQRLGYCVTNAPGS